MNRRFFLIAALVAACGLTGCWARVATVTVSDDGYWLEAVYLYDHGCWADAYWYAPCRWSPGPYYGYYYYHFGTWWYHSGRSWRYAPGLPPPPRWRGFDSRRHRAFPAQPPPHWRGPPPPRGGHHSKPAPPGHPRRPHRQVLRISPPFSGGF